MLYLPSNVVDPLADVETDPGYSNRGLIEQKIKPETLRPRIDTARETCGWYWDRNFTETG